MIGMAGKVRVWARSQPTDLRKGYAGLAGLVERELGGDLVSGDLFVFISKRRTSLKLLHWDGTGIWAPVNQPDKSVWMIGAPLLAGRDSVPPRIARDTRAPHPAPLDERRAPSAP